MTDDTLDLTVLDENDEEVSDPDLTINGQAVSGDGSGDGAPTDGTYVTTGDESDALPESTQHSDLSGGDLHDPAEHDNGAHNLAFISDGDGVERTFWLVPAGADDPADAGPEDIILEEES